MLFMGLLNSSGPFSVIHVLGHCRRGQCCGQQKNPFHTLIDAAAFPWLPATHPLRKCIFNDLGLPSLVLHIENAAMWLRLLQHRH